MRSVLSEDGFQAHSEQETTDIYLLPPHEDPETCTSWLRMRNRDGHYTLMFEAGGTLRTTTPSTLNLLPLFLASV